MFQIIFGRKAIGGDIKLKFGTVCFISFLGQILLPFITFKIIVLKLEKENNACGMPLVGLIIVSLFFTIILFITMSIQERIKKSYEAFEIEEIEEEEDKIIEDDDDEF